MKAIHVLTAITLFLAIIGSVAALPIVLEEVEIDDVVLRENSENRLSLERGDEYEVEIKFTPTQNIDDAEVRVFISGFEYSDVEEIEDKTPTFDADENVTYVKRLKVYFPDDVDEDDYKLRVIIADRFSDIFLANYNLKLDVPRHALKIEDVIFSPASTVRAGSALLATVRLENKGEQDQDDVRVSVKIPGLNVEGTSYIEEIDEEDEEETEEIFIRIPKCAPAGNYEVVVDAEFSQRHRRTSMTRAITVLEDETCEEDRQAQTTITLGNQMQSASAGQTAIFPITVTNAGKTSKTFIVSVPNADWATISVTPTSTLVVPAGQTQTVFVNVQLAEDIPAGAHSLTATVSSNDHVQELTLTTTVAESASGAKGALEIILIILVVLLVILGIVVGIGYLRGKDAETYY